MEAVNGLASSVEAKLGVSTGFAQVLTWLLVLAVAYLALQALQGLGKGVLKSSRGRGNVALILGQCGAGKTVLFFRLRDRDEEVQTVSSMKPIRDTLQINAGEGEEALGPIEVVDYPGHLRLRGKSADLLKDARCIIYVIDSEDKQRLKDVAEHLYELLTHPEVLELHTPILLTFNKSDLPSARPEKFILDEIDREIEQMRVSRAATLEGQDQADSYLGVDGEKFKIMEHAPCPIQTCRISAKKVQLAPLYDFLRQQFA
uniref:Signal recognition particle receptor subunit beta n=1 Tax=Alexandrium catenella TaxID=2925 RepID=A0A7S1RE66_ALECA|mmetsp:Transcript_5467/g.14517  ORF Transcript_5467/g.14517 Transcript_5467/m.14517 type:complete len:259 (+) Transcript_5467:82-858(+)